MLRAHALVLVAALAISGNFGHKTLAAPIHVSQAGTFVRLDTTRPVEQLVRSVSRQLGLRGGDGEDVQSANVAVFGTDENVVDQVPEEAKDMAVIPPNPCKVYVGNLPMTTTEEEFKPFVETAGSVVSIDLRRDRGGRCKGFALVEYSSAEAALQALDKLSGASFSRRSVILRPDQGLNPVQMAEKREKRNKAIEAAKAAQEAGIEPVRPRRKMQGHPHYWPRAVKGSRVYVGNIRFGTSWQEVRDHMAQAGRVEFGKIIKTASTQADGTTRYVSRGFAIVQFTTAEEATAATETLDQLPLNGRNLYVRVDDGNYKRTKQTVEPVEMENKSEQAAPGA